MSNTSIYVWILSYVLVFALDNYFEAKHGNEYQFRRESIEVKYSADITKCTSHTTIEYDRCVTKAEITRNASTIGLYAKYKEGSTSRLVLK